ncbi:MAG: hypothetical protein QME96_17185, partial [Myxococcota bacterium]|nr:hypothetical protein [Myxococcota bacterium]
AARGWGPSGGRNEGQGPTIVLDQALAAAGEGCDDAAACGQVELGVLAPLPVEAILTAREAGRVELMVADPGHALGAVSFGGVASRGPDAHGRWRATVAFSDEPLELRAVSRSGEQFDAWVRLRIGVRR